MISFQLPHCKHNCVAGVVIKTTDINYLYKWHSLRYDWLSVVTHMIY